MTSYTFDTIAKEIELICRGIVRSHWQPDYIVGLSRGGLVPGVMISHWLNVPFKPLEVSLRDGGYCKSSKFLAREAYGLNEDGVKKNILIVDDINDTGQTFNWIMRDWSQTCGVQYDKTQRCVWNNTVRFAVIVNKITSKCDVGIDYEGRITDNNWIHFPWEV
jgi:xanthine phosphoribosyltransferase